MCRKSIIVTTLVGVVIVADLPAITAELHKLGVIPIAQSIHAEYLTGTAVAVIVALLLLLPSTHFIGVRKGVAQCPVCDCQLRHHGRHCPACGSRVHSGKLAGRSPGFAAWSRRSRPCPHHQ